MLGQSIKQNTIGLGAFAVLTAGVVGFTQLHTQARINDNVRQAQAAILNEILPADSHNNDLLAATLPITDPTLTAGEAGLLAYIARQDGRFVGIVIPTVAPDGYSGKIHSMVGIDASGIVTGVRVLAHQETPGLGDKVERKKSSWILQFDNRSLDDPAPERWTVRKDGGQFDQMTGATITPRAVIHSVRRALEFFATHQEELLRPLPVSESSTPEVESSALEVESSTPEVESSTNATESAMPAAQSAAPASVSPVRSSTPAAQSSTPELEPSIPRVEPSATAAEASASSTGAAQASAPLTQENPDSPAPASVDSGPAAAPSDASEPQAAAPLSPMPAPATESATEPPAEAQGDDANDN